MNAYFIVNNLRQTVYESVMAQPVAWALERHASGLVTPISGDAITVMRGGGRS